MTLCKMYVIMFANHTVSRSPTNRGIKPLKYNQSNGTLHQKDNAEQMAYFNPGAQYTISSCRSFEMSKIWLQLTQ